MKNVYFTLLLAALCITANAQVVTTLAGIVAAGSTDGVGSGARFNGPYGVTLYGADTLFVADFGNNEIRKIVISTATVTTFAGSTTAGSADGTGTAATFNKPLGIVADGKGNLYVVDNGNNEIRKIVIATAAVTTFAGSTTSGSNDGTGTAAKFNRPAGIAIDGSGTNLYLADNLNNEIRQIVISSAAVTTLAGSTTSGSANGVGAAARFFSPFGVVVYGLDTLFVADQINNEIRKIVISTATVSTFAGSLAAGSTNGIGAAAKFYDPYSVTVDGSGNLYVADYYNNEIRQIVISNASVSTYAGSTTPGSVDGTGATARFYYPAGVVSDASGNLYVGDRLNDEIRMITPVATAVNNTVEKNSISVYPNPTSNKLTIDLNNNGEQAKIIIYNLLGETMYSTIINSKLNIDVSNFTTGIYFAEVATGNCRKVVKFIKE